MVSVSSLLIALTLTVAIRDAGAFVKREADLHHHKLAAVKDALAGSLQHSSASHLNHSKTLLRDGQPDFGGAVTSTSSESYLERLQNAMTQFVVGWVLIFFSIPVLFFNERRLARMESLVITGQKEVSAISAKQADEDKFGCLVHLQNESMVAAGPVKDPQFDVTLESDCVRLQTLVEVFQVIEHEKTQEKEKFGGGKEKITTYTYNEEWSSIWRDSGNYNNHVMRGKNWKPEGLNAGSVITDCKKVEFGESFLLSGALVQQCSSWTSAESMLGESIALQRGQEHFQKGAGGFFWLRRNSKAWRGDGAPQVGDCRVKFSYIPNGPASVLALQAKAKGEERASFLPYRVIQRPCFGTLDPEEKKRAFLDQGRKGPEELAEEDGCPGCFPTLCCCICNCVAKCCSALLTPEINHLWEGDKSVGACFKDVESRAVSTTWAIRLCGWLMMFVGLMMTFAPFTEILVIIPFLGPILKSCAGFIVAVFSFVVTVLVALVIIMIAWLAYHPLYALFYALLVGAVMAAPVVINMLFMKDTTA